MGFFRRFRRRFRRGYGDPWSFRRTTVSNHDSTQYESDYFTKENDSANQPADSTDSFGLRGRPSLALEMGKQIGQKEQKLEDIHTDIRFIRDEMALARELSQLRTELREELIRLGVLTTASRDLVLEKLAYLYRIQSPNQPTHSTHSPTHSPDSGSGVAREKSSMASVVHGLTAKEREMCHILINNGALDYHAIGAMLEISHISAKNLINRLLKDPAKATLIHKADDGGKAIIKVRPEYHDMFKEDSDIPPPSEMFNN